MCLYSLGKQDMSDEVYVHVRVVAAMKQPMEADVSGETAEALL